MSDFSKFLSHGVSTREFVTEAGGVKNAAKNMYEYVVGECADETESYDPDAATELRQTSYQDVLTWLQGEMKCIRKF
jgi:hypothetical protein